MRILAIVFLLLGLAHNLPAANDGEVAARKSALDLAGAFANDGFKTRDGIWNGNIGGAKLTRVVQVNLFAGNQYWFCFGSTASVKGVHLALFDEKGKPVDFDGYTGETNAAVGFSPQISGPYYVKIQELEGEPTECCLLYCYK